MLLPFAEREYVSVKRAASILGVSHRAVLDMYDAGLIEVIDYAFGKRKRVRYASLVDLCDRLRRQFGIEDRRPPLSAPYLRHRDADVLPFPISDTIYVKEACDVLGYSSLRSVYNMIDEGHFEAYQFTANSPWRISRSSLHAFVADAQRRASEHITRR
jgi:excisionase family DNA binding protein